MEQEFQVYHDYNKLVRRGLTKPLVHGCGTEFVLILNRENDQPALRCLACNTLTLPGLTMYSDIQAVVKEHFT